MIQVGDRVRLMSGREEGTVTRVLEGGNVLEVAIDGEFTIPLLRSDVVPISTDEVKAFGARPAPPPVAPPKPGSSPQTTAAANAKASPAGGRPTPPKAGSAAPGALKAPSTAPAAIGAYLVLTYQAEELLAVQVVNNSDDDLLFTYGEEKQDRYIGRKSGVVGPRAAVAVAHLHMRDFETWPAVVIQYLPHRTETAELHALETARVRFKANTFYNSRGPAPLVRQEGYVFRLAEHRLVVSALLPGGPVGPVGAVGAVGAASPGLDAGALAAQLQKSAGAPTVKLTPPPHEVDLHLDKLADAPDGEVTNTEALRLQMAAFQDALDRAIATNMHEIVFIHGVGTGALRKEIHRALSRDARIKFFEEAQKEKFGFGATRVRLK